MEDLSFFSNNSRQVTKVFKALSDGTRQEILHLLEGHERSVGEIVGEFSLSQPTISRHLSVLKEADLVVDKRRGQNVIYSLNDSTLSNSMQQFCIVKRFPTICFLLLLGISQLAGCGGKNNEAAPEKGQRRGGSSPSTPKTDAPRKRSRSRSQGAWSSL